MVSPFLNHDLLNRNLKNIFLDFDHLRHDDLDVLLRVGEETKVVAATDGTGTRFLDALLAVFRVVHQGTFVPLQPFLLVFHEEPDTSTVATTTERGEGVEWLTALNPELTMEANELFTEFLKFNERLVLVMGQDDVLITELPGFGRGHFSMARIEIPLDFPVDASHSAYTTGGAGGTELELVRAVALAVIGADRDGEVAALSRQLFTGKVFLRTGLLADRIELGHVERQGELVIGEVGDKTPYLVATHDAARLLATTVGQVFNLARNVRGNGQRIEKEALFTLHS